MRSKTKKSPAAVACSALGTILLIFLVLACIPLTLPRIFGYQIYTVVSGSMEPAIPVGSLVYISPTDPSEVEEDDVIAFYGARDSASIVTHRVVSNSNVMGEFITKGDANETEDMNPVSYDNYIGKVVLSIPVLGGIAQVFTSTPGKILAGCVIGVAVLLHLLASFIHKREQEGRR